MKFEQQPLRIGMSLTEILNGRGWETEPRNDWVAVQDRRPEFRAAFKTDRVGKIIDTKFFVTLTQFPEVTKGLIRQVGREPIAVASKSGARDATYWGFDTNGAADGDLKIFFRWLADAINDLL